MQKPEKWYVEKKSGEQSHKGKGLFEENALLTLSSVSLNLRVYSSIVSHILLRPNWQD